MISWLLILVFFSGSGIIFLLAIRFLPVKNLSKDELYQGIVSSKPFFSDFNKYLRPAVKLAAKVCASVFSRKEFAVLKKHYCNFSDYMHGRHLVKKNGCSGYWEEVNGYKKNNKENSNLPG